MGFCVKSIFIFQFLLSVDFGLVRVSLSQTLVEGQIELKNLKKYNFHILNLEMS